MPGSAGPSVRSHAASDPVGQIVKALLSIALIGLLGFCAFGLLATQEPMDEGNQKPWQLIYGGLAALSLSILAWIWWPRGGKARG